MQARIMVDFVIFAKQPLTTPFGSPTRNEANLSVNVAPKIISEGARPEFAPENDARPDFVIEHLPAR